MQYTVIFIPIFRTNDPVQEVVPSKSATGDVLIPLEVQSGFTLPAGVDGNRFLLSIGK
jgi:hypothetical protein